MKFFATFVAFATNMLLMNEIEPEWTVVVEEIGPALYRFFLGSFPAPAASDLVQETLIRLVQKYRDGDFDLSNQVYQIAHLKWAIAQRKPIEQEIILQMIDGESSFKKISEQVNMPVGTVKSHIHRAKEKQRRQLSAQLFIR